MMSNIFYNAIEIVIGFASGIMIGGGFVGLLTILGIIPRLVHLSNSNHLLIIYPFVLIFGVQLGTYLSFTEITWHYSPPIIIIWGLLQGIFNGMIAAALAEILNVFPLLAKRIGLQKYILYLLFAIVLGKMFGSLMQWIFIVQP